MADSSTLAQVASIIVAFGTAMMLFRIERELQMAEKGEQIWIPYSDRLLIGATLLSLFFVIVPIVLFDSPIDFVVTLARASSTASAIMVGGYVFGILAHYRLILGQGRTGPRDNPEPAEKNIVNFAFFASVVLFLIVLFDLS